MTKKAKQFPAELELRILKILWREGALRVRNVRQGLAEQGRNLAHTTVVTTLNTMVDKQFVTRTQELNAYIFEACVSKDDVSQWVLGDIVDRVFDGSPKAVMLSLFDCSDIEDEELKELRQIINRKMKSN